MKRIIALMALLSLGLTACSTNLSVATPEDVDAYPESVGIMKAWQGMVDAAADEDCADFQEYARKSVGMAEGECVDAFEFMADAPAIDWSKTQWDANQGKGKIYEEGKGDLTSFIYNESDKVWRFDTAFWLN
jgi:hypothetical protein